MGNTVADVPATDGAAVNENIVQQHLNEISKVEALGFLVLKRLLAIGKSATEEPQGNKTATPAAEETRATSRPQPQRQEFCMRRASQALGKARPTAVTRRLFARAKPTVRSEVEVPS